MKLTPLGSVPVSDNAAFGYPVDLTVKVPPEPTVNVVLDSLVIAGASSTVNVKFCAASGETPSRAEIEIAYAPPEPAFGVPASVAVPSPLSTNVTPSGSDP